MQRGLAIAALGLVLESWHADIEERPVVADAVTATITITIEHVRAAVQAQRVRIKICGDEIPIPRLERRRLDPFVRDCDDIGLFVGPSAPAPPPKLGPDHEWRVWNPAQAPFPAPAQALGNPLEDSVGPSSFAMKSQAYWNRDELLKRRSQTTGAAPLWRR